MTDQEDLSRPSSGPSLLLLQDERCLPLLPLLYAVWADGILEAAEIEAVWAQVEDHFGRDTSWSMPLASWLDPNHPPDPHQLNTLLTCIRKRAASLKTRSTSLFELGIHLGGASPAEAVRYWQNTKNLGALEKLCDAIGINQGDAVEEILPRGKPPRHQSAATTEEAAAVFPADDLFQLMEGPYAQLKTQVRTLLVDLLARQPGGYNYEQGKEQQRAQVLAWLGELAAHGLGRKAYPDLFATELGEFIAVFETLAFFDLSLVVKFGVQFGLFGGSIYFLGSPTHRKEYLPDIAAGRLLGCFAMTELEHGSNVRDLRTQATFDSDQDEWVIHTPDPGARKEWIGNAAAHGQMAVVFAQLSIGDLSYGVHAFLVPIRSKTGRVAPGVSIEDCGHKMGLNGVDNGRISFEQVRVPRTNLLNRFAQVDRQGQYTSPITGDSKRFFTMLGTLVGGRVGIAGASISVAKSALTIAVRYGVMRRQFGPAGKPETRILDYPTHQRRLMPRLAATYALAFSFQELAAMFSAQDETQRRELETLAAGMKVYATRHTTDTLQICRECCGGQGFLSSNRMPRLKADSDVFTTFEGDNTVLLQLVAKNLLMEYRHQYSGSFARVLKLVAGRTNHVLGQINPIRGRRWGRTFIRSREMHLNALLFRETDLRHSLAGRLRKRLGAGMSSFEAMTACQNHFLVLARAHVERHIYEAFCRAVDGVQDQSLQTMLGQLTTLYGLWTIENSAAWYLEQDYMEGSQAKAIRRQVTRLCAEVRGQAWHLVEAFGIPDSLLAADIAFPI